MYPSHFFSLFPPFPRDNKVFVAMSFREDFNARWQEVIEPAIRNVHVEEVPLEPYRVDARRVSDCILTEILTGISNSRLVFADVSTIGELGAEPIRNGNVMYEVGIAHAVRAPEEVILFRSDDRRLLFDVANVRVNAYDPDRAPERARELVVNALVDAVKEIDLRRNLAVLRACESLDYVAWDMLMEANVAGLDHPTMRTMGQALVGMPRLAAISRLLELGLLRTEYAEVTSAEQLVKYGVTPFGQAVMVASLEKMKILLPPRSRQPGFPHQASVEKPWVLPPELRTLMQKLLAELRQGGNEAHKDGAACQGVDKPAV